METASIIIQKVGVVTFSFSCLQSVRQTTLQDITNWMETDKEKF